MKIRDKAQDAAQALYEQLNYFQTRFNELAKSDAEIDLILNLQSAMTLVTLFYKQNKVESRGNIDDLRPQIRDI